MFVHLIYVIDVKPLNRIVVFGNKQYNIVLLTFGSIKYMFYLNG